MSIRALTRVDGGVWGVRQGLLEDEADSERVRIGILCALLR